LAGNRTRCGWVTVPALVDSCFFACGLYLWAQKEGLVGVPRGVGHLRLGRPAKPGEHCLLRFDCRQREQDRRHFDFVVTGEDGATILKAERYCAVLVGIRT
jgi:hypothetical protein